MEIDYSAAGSWWSAPKSILGFDLLTATIINLRTPAVCRRRFILFSIILIMRGRGSVRSSGVAGQRWMTGCGKEGEGRINLCFMGGLGGERGKRLARSKKLIFGRMAFVRSWKSRQL